LSSLRPPPRANAQEKAWSEFADFVSHLRVSEHVVLPPIVEDIAGFVVPMALVETDGHLVFSGRRKEERDGIRLV